MELAQSARRLFDRQVAREKRRLLDFVFSNCSWKGGELSFELCQACDILARA
jgi:site-specific DNA recombinase